MPLLDVTSVLYDPMFMDVDGTYTRQTQTIGAHGRAVNTPVTTMLPAVYTNKDGFLLQRGADSEHVEAVITVHTPVRLTTGSSGIPADIVTWDGASYTVTSIGNYSKYGAGFVEATCELIELDGGTEP